MAVGNVDTLRGVCGIFRMQRAGVTLVDMEALGVDRARRTPPFVGLISGAGASRRRLEKGMSMSRG